MDSFWKICIKAVLKKFPESKKYEVMDSDIDTIGSIFEDEGGSWENLAKGSSSEWGTLRDACKKVLKLKVENEKR